MRALRIAAAVELLSPAVLLVNLVTVHAKPVTSLAGPVHGTAYLAVIAATALFPGVSAGTRWRSAIPGVGGLLVLRRIPRPDHLEGP
ncbi:hypothetical protein ACFYOT_40300 [Saccharothrix saharensis]|uniref:hypothetical protein n=1 Tax=Saccharothrix saharensis TaxID=571190 RepID=UPI0036C1F1DE